MKNLEGVVLGGRVRLTSKAYEVKGEENIWLNEARRLDNGQIMHVYLFNPSLDSQVIDEKISSLEVKKKQKAYYSAAEEVNNHIFSYVIFEAPTTLIPDKPAIKPVQSQTPPKPKPEGAKVPAWLFASAIGVMVFACIVAGLLGGPTIMAALQPPTPIATVTPTPQIFIFVQDTAVTNFLTRESFVIPKDSKAIIENPTHAECEVLANWNGTQIIIPAKVVFPDRTTCP